jgi:glycosyltransferase involved in cell wall biosynthesis
MKTLILITAFNVEQFIEKVIVRFPKDLKKSQLNIEILIIDDASNDSTLKKIKSIKDKYKDYKITCISNKVNLGYGGNQKNGYYYAIKNNFDYVVLLHGDGQYAPEKVLDMLNPLVNNRADAVQGSRMIKKTDALKGGMPLYKFVGNIILTFIQNLLTGLNLSEYHSGYRSYRVSALKEIPFKLNSNQFEFDTQILIQFSIAKKKIYEIPIPTFYGKEFSSLIWYKYGFAILNTTIVYYLQRFGIFYDKKFNFIRGKVDNYESEKKD